MIIRDDNKRPLFEFELDRNSDGSGYLTKGWNFKENRELTDKELDEWTDWLADDIYDECYQGNVMAAEYACESDR